MPTILYPVESFWVNRFHLAYRSPDGSTGIMQLARGMVWTVTTDDAGSYLITLPDRPESARAARTPQE